MFVLLLINIEKEKMKLLLLHRGNRILDLRIKSREIYYLNKHHIM